MIMILNVKRVFSANLVQSKAKDKTSNIRRPDFENTLTHNQGIGLSY